jgi:hypothetical protein
VLVVQLELEPLVILAVGILHGLLDRMREQHHVDLLRGLQALERGEEDAPFVDLGVDPLLVSAADVVLAGDALSPAQLREEQRLRPVDRIDHERLEAAGVEREVADRLEDLAPRLRRREARDVEVPRAILGAEEDRFGAPAAKVDFPTPSTP